MRPDAQKDLVDRWLTGELDAAGEAELERLLREDGDFARELLEQQQMEQALRILMADDTADQQVTVSVLSVLRAEPLDTFKSGLMAQVRQENEKRQKEATPRRLAPVEATRPSEARPEPVRISRPAPRRLGLLLSLSAAAALLLAAGLAWMSSGREASVDEGRAFLLSASGAAQVQRGPQRLNARQDLGLQPGDQLVLEEGASVRVGFSDDPTFLELKGPAALRLLKTGPAKQVELLRGEFEAAGALAASTPQAELRFVDAVARLQSAKVFSRVEVSRGQVLFTRKSDHKAVRVPVEHYAVAGGDVELAARPLDKTAPSADGPGVIAVVKQVQGQVFLFTKSPADRTPLRAGQAILEKQSVLTEGARAQVVLEYPDRTRIEIGGDTVVRRLADEKDRTRKSVLLEQGALTADVTKQPEGKPMILRTAQAEATVLGTRFLLAAEREATRLSVEEGAVSFMRQADRQAVTVRSGFTSVAAPGRSLDPVPVPGGARYLAIDLASGVADGDGDWAVEGRTVRQRRVSRLAEGGMSTLLFRSEAPESLVIEAVVELEQVTPDTASDRGTWGFGLEAMFRNRTVVLRSSQGPEGASVFEFFGISAIPFEHGREGTYRIKLAVDRRREGEAVLRGKIWQGDREPDGWMIENQFDLDGPLTQVGLQTVRSACAFSSFKVRLLKEEPR